MNLKVFVWLDGRVVPASQARISVSDSAYLYGLGVFETLRAVGLNALFLKDHVARFRKNSSAIGIRPVSVAVIQNAIHQLLRATRWKQTTLRMILSQDGGQPRLVITARPFIPYPQRCYTRGAKTITAKDVPADVPVIAHLKTTSYLTKMMARREAARRGADEAILINAKGLVTEGSSSNLFIVRDGILYTPPLTDGLLPGTRRKAIPVLARALKIRCLEKSISTASLKKADEVFLTSSLKDVMPVGVIDGKKVGQKSPGPLTQLIQAAYQKKFVTRISRD